MDKNNTSLKNTLRGNSDLPESMSWDAMSDGILSGLDTTPKNEKRKRRLPIFWVLSSLIILIGIVSISLMSETNPHSHEETLEERLITTQTIPTTQDQLIDDHLIDQSTPPTLASNSEITTKQEITETNLPIELNQARQNGNTNSRVNSDPTFANKRTIQNQANLANDTVVKSVTEQSSNQVLIPSTLSLSPNLDVKDGLLISENLSMPIALAVLNPTFPQREYYLDLDDKLIEPLSKTNSKYNLPNGQWSIALAAGVNSHKVNWDGNDLANLRNTHSSPIIGQSAGLLIGYHINQKWNVEAGIIYDRQVDFLDYTRSLDTIITGDVTILNTNNASGVTTTTNETRDLNGIYDQQIKWYNVNHSISLPFKVNRMFVTNSKLTPYLGIGIQQQFSIQRDGKYLAQLDSNTGYASVEELSTSQYNDYQLQVMGAAGLTYRLSESTDINVGIEGIQSITNVTNESQTTGSISSMRGLCSIRKTL